MTARTVEALPSAQKVCNAACTRRRKGEMNQEEAARLQDPTQVINQLAEDNARLRRALVAIVVAGTTDRGLIKSYEARIAEAALLDLPLPEAVTNRTS